MHKINVPCQLCNLIGMAAPLKSHLLSAEEKIHRIDDTQQKKVRQIVWGSLKRQYIINNKWLWRRKEKKNGSEWVCGAIETIALLSNSTVMIRVPPLPRQIDITRFGPHKIFETNVSHPNNIDRNRIDFYCCWMCCVVGISVVCRISHGFLLG